MLIIKCKLFSDDADLQLAKLYLEQCDEITQDALVDQLGFAKGADWWSGLLSRTVTDEMWQLLSDAAMSKRSLQTADVIFERLSEEDRIRMYKWALGLRDEQPISLDSMLRNVGHTELRNMGPDPIERYDAVYKAMKGGDDSTREEPWLGLTDLTYKLPIPASIRDDVHQLIWQVRRIFQAGAPTPQPSIERSDVGIVREFFTGTFKTLLWQEGSDEIVCSLNEEYETILEMGYSSEGVINRDRLEYLSFALQNKNLSSEIKASIFDALLDGGYGDTRLIDFTSLLKRDVIPDHLFNEVVDCYLNKGMHSQNRHFKVSVPSDQLLGFIDFLGDPRLSADNRAAVIRSRSAVMHDYIRMPDFSLKHAKSLTSEEIAFKLNKLTQGHIAIDGSGCDYITLVESMSIKEAMSLKDTLGKDGQELKAIINNCSLPSETIIQLTNLFLAVNAPSKMDLFVGKGSLGESTVLALYNHLCNLPGDLGVEQRRNIDLAILKVGQIYLASTSMPDAQLKHYLDRQLMNRALSANLSGSSEVTCTPVPVSLNSLISAIEHQPGYAFELIDQFIQRHNELAANATDRSWDTANFNAGLSEESQKLGILIKLAMTREIYPAIINGRELDLPLCERMLKLAVAHCKIEEFDMQLLNKINNPDHFLTLANALFDEPVFMQSHHQAYEELTALVLKRKTTKAMASVTVAPANRSRPCL